jgi:hypothetical protein
MFRAAGRGLSVRRIRAALPVALVLFWDGLGVVGLGAIVFGVYRIYPPAGIIAGGVVAVGLVALRAWTTP